MDELTQLKADLHKLQIKYNSAIQTIAANTGQSADQAFDLGADLAIAQARIAELEKRLTPPETAVEKPGEFE